MSPYISWGNLSVRYVWQTAEQAKRNGASRFQLNAFTSRLRWQAHFIQKFEWKTEWNLKASIRICRFGKSPNETYIQAWKTGQTGFPLIDASMRCLIQTGYINFRMRAMLVSLRIIYGNHGNWASSIWQNNFWILSPEFIIPNSKWQAGETGIKYAAHSQPRQK